MRCLLLLPGLLLVLPGCDPKVAEDTGTGDSADSGVDTADSDTSTDSGDDSGEDSGEDSGDDTGDDTSAPPPHWQLVVATTDYTTGALATIDEDGTVHDSLIPISADAAIVADRDTVYVLNRSSENTVVVYEHGDFTTPTAEFSTGDGSNPTGITRCGANLFVSRYLYGDIGVYDAVTGLAVGSVDLSAFDDGDGSAEPDSIYTAPNGSVYVSLNQIDYGGSYNSVDGSGTLVQLDCDNMTVLASWDVGPNPHFEFDPGNPAMLYLNGGNYFNADYSGPELDGGVYTFDTNTNTLVGPHLTEAAVSYNIGSVVSSGLRRGFTTLDNASVWTPACLNLDTWAYLAVDAGNVYIGSHVATPDGTVWAAQGRGYGSGAPGAVGIVPYDTATCVAGTGLRTALPPASLAVRVW